MKKLISTILILTAFVANSYALSPIMVDDNNIIVSPTRDEIVEANDLNSGGLSTTNLSIIVDLFMSGVRSSANNYLYNTYNSTTATNTAYYTDCVLKVLDADGNIIYFFSTVLYYSTQLQALHAGEDIYDSGAKVYYFPTGRNNDYTNGTTNLRAKQEFPSTAWSSYCIATYEYALSKQLVYQGTTKGTDGRIRITAIQIYPSAKYHHIFTNPENTIVVHLQTPTLAELDGNGHHVYKAAVLQY